MIFELDRRESIYFKNGFINKPLFVLCDRESIPNVTIMHDIIVRMESKMGESGFSKMNGALQEALGKIL